MKNSCRTRYRPVDNGYEIIGGREIFNRTLYGSHANDELPERYFTFAGDLPLFMGAVTDWSKHTACHYAKNGVLISGLALTPGIKIPAFYSADLDLGSRWFHQAEDVVAVFRNGWMEYELRQFSPWFPNVKVNIAAFPLLPEDGFLVHYRIETDQRVIFSAGFGGITGFIGRFEYPEAEERNFHASDCQDNTVICGKNRALLKGKNGTSMWIGASFSVEVAVGDALSLQNCPPGTFLGSKAVKKAPPVVKISSPIGAGETLDGFIVVLRNQDERVLESWLERKDPVQYLKRQINLKKAGVAVNTPDPMLNQTTPPTVLAVDASWHKNNFYHGAHGYHSPFLGWRNWYGPTVIGWHERVKTAIAAHAAQIVRTAPGKEMVWYDGKDRPDLDHEGTQYHQIRNSTGFMPCILGGNDIYNMQEVAVDMLLHHLEWTGDLELARQLFADLRGILDWEERILDPDGDGLYQNFLNTWISDGHSYNGGGCAQASSYNYRANKMLAEIAKKLGLPAAKFAARAQKIRAAIQSRLYLPEAGVIAEYVDTIGNKLVHPSPELATAYLAIDCGVVDDLQAYTMLRFTETELRNERTRNRGGRLVYSSNWYPKKYSTCGLFTAENIHLALAYFKTGQKGKALEIMDALTDAYFDGRNPGLISHVLTGRGADDLGDIDFTDVSSMYLRLLVEGLFGIRFQLLAGCIEIAPAFPDEWTRAGIKLSDISLQYKRKGRQEKFTVRCEKNARKTLKIPLRSNRIEAVSVNGAPHAYRLEAAVGACFAVIETAETGTLQVEVMHGSEPKPAILRAATAIPAGNKLLGEISGAVISECIDPTKLLKNLSFSGRKISARTSGRAGNYTLFIRVKTGEYESYLPYDYRVEAKAAAPLRHNSGVFKPVDMAKYLNCSLAELHKLEYRSPRPEGYSIGVRLNGRYAWEWNHCGHNAVQVDDAKLRKAGGIFRTSSGIAFSTPAAGNNIAGVSLWDNFPTKLAIPLSGRARELALLFIGVTNPMQSYVENARISIVYADGGRETVSLVHPRNFDDWLVPALQPENETVYFSDYNHAIVQRIPLEPAKELAEVVIEAVANEVIVGLLGISIK